MSKTKKSKLLASMLCATVMAGLYAGPVMAGSVDSITGDNTGVHINIGYEMDENTSVNGGTINGSDGLYVTGALGNSDGALNHKIAGRLTISSEAIVNSLESKSFNELTIGGTTFNTTNIQSFKTEYEELKNKVDQLEGGEDLTPRVEALETNTTGISRDGNTTKISGSLETGTITAANGNFKVTDTGAITAQRGSKIGSAYFGNGYVSVNDGNETEASIGGNHRDGGYLKLNTKDDELVELTGDQLRDIKNGTQNIKYDEGNRQTVIEGATSFDASGMGIESMGGQTTLVGGQAVFRDQNGQFTQVMGGTVNASQDVVAVGTKTSELEEKTTAIEYTPGNPDGIGSQKLGTTTINDILKADVFTANSGTVGGVTMMDGSLYAASGNFLVDETGNVTAKMVTTENVASANYDLETVGSKLSDLDNSISGDDGLVKRVEKVEYNTSEISVVGSGNNKWTNVSSNMNVQGDFKVSGNTEVSGNIEVSGNTKIGGTLVAQEVANKQGVTLSNLDSRLDIGEADIDALQNKTTDIRYADGVTEIGNGALAVNNEGYVTINQGMITADISNGLVTMGNNIELNTQDGIIKAENFQTNKYDLNSVGEELDALGGSVSVDISDLKRKTTDIEYADGVTTIANTTNFSEDGMQVNAGSSYLNVDKDKVVLTNNGSGISISDEGMSLFSQGGSNEIRVTNTGTEFVNALNGTTTIIDGGAITADSLTLGEMNVKEAITNLQDTVGGMVDAGLPDKVAGIERNGETTTIEGTLSVSKDFIGANIEGSIFGVSDEDVTIAHGSNGIAINNMGVQLSGNVYFDGKDGNSYTLADLEDRVSILEDKTQNITGSKPGTGEGGSTVPPTNDGHTGIEGDVTVGGEINAGSGTIGGVTMEDGQLTADKATIGDVTVGGSLNVADKVTADKDGVTVKGDGENNVKIDGNDVSVSWKDDEGNSYETSIRDNYEAINDLDNRVTGEVNRLDNRIDKVEDRVDKVGAMAAAIANLRTMGYDPAAPTEIAVGIGQYRDETGAALGLFHYPNRDFMLSLSVSTSGDEVMGGIGATWKFGRKTPEQMLAAEKEKAAKAKLAKAEAMKKAAAEAKVAAQQERHAKMAAEKVAK